MNKYIITFGTDHLKEIANLIRPLKAIVTIEASSEKQAREKIFRSFIGKKFCTTYPYEPNAQNFKDDYQSIEIQFNTLVDYIESDIQSREASQLFATNRKKLLNEINKGE